MADKQAKSKKLSKDEEQDTAMATAMGATVLASEQARQGIDQMMGSAEPILAIGQVVANALLHLKEQSDKQGMGFSDNIWMAQGGVADRLIKEVVRDVDARTGEDMTSQSDKIWIEVVNFMKMAGSAGSNPQQQGAPQQGMGQKAGVPMGPLGGM